MVILLEITCGRTETVEAAVEGADPYGAVRFHKNGGDQVPAQAVGVGEVASVIGELILLAVVFVQTAAVRADPHAHYRGLQRWRG